jgi:G-protein coupled receptor 98
MILVLIIEDKKDYGSINVSILSEAVPELSESFTVSLGDIQLVTSRYINYGYMNGLQVDMPPETGPKNKVEFSILKNDDAHGVVEFRQSRLVVHEHDRRVVVSVLRTGGSY